MFWRKSIFTIEEKTLIAQSIRVAEARTSGEIRVFIEAKCRQGHPLDRAVQEFQKLGMHQTSKRNGVLLYIALLDRKAAIFGDTAIHAIVGTDFWKTQLSNLSALFAEERYTEGITKCIEEIGDVLEKHFPYEDGGKNELPDDIVFGKGVK